MSKTEANQARHHLLHAHEHLQKIDPATAEVATAFEHLSAAVAEVEKYLGPEHIEPHDASSHR